jgi:hypothetical protein
MVNGILLGLVQSVLGKGNATSKGNYAFHCSLCNHRKPKLEINLIPTTKNENPWHCWACDAKGKTISSLFKAVKVEGNKYSELNSILGTTTKIDTSDFNSNVEALIKYVKFVDQTPEVYEQYKAEPLFNVMPTLNSLEEFLRNNIKVY